MFSFSIALLSSTLLAAVTTAAPVSQSPSYNARSVHNFPNNTWIENMAVRSNGQILASNMDGGNVFLVNPFQPNTTTPPVIASFGKNTSLFGITEVEDDVFYVQGVRDSNALAFQVTANASAVWKIDMRPYQRTGQAAVSKVADIPQILAPNGMTLLSKSAGTVLISDSALGNIWRFNVHTGQSELVIDDAVLKPVADEFVPTGVNGLRVIGSKLYFTNTNRGYLATFTITPDGHALGQPTFITKDIETADDFAVGPDGSVWVARNVKNEVDRVFPDGKVVTVLTGATTPTLYAPVSVRFGRTKKDKDVLYISTDGLIGLDKHGVPLTTDGKILAIETC